MLFSVLKVCYEVFVAVVLSLALTDQISLSFHLYQCALYPEGVHDNLCDRDDMETYRLWSADLHQEPVERV